MSIELILASDLSLTVDEATAFRLLEQLTRSLEGVEGLRTARILDDDDPRWVRHSGGAGHADQEWGPTDNRLAAAFYIQLRGKAKVFLDLLLDHPGRELTVDELIAASGGQFTSSNSIAGAINGLRLRKQESDRRYPFYWWEGTPSRYAVKISVARLFNEARGMLST